MSNVGARRRVHAAALTAFIVLIYVLALRVVLPLQPSLGAVAHALFAYALFVEHELYSERALRRYQRAVDELARPNGGALAFAQCEPCGRARIGRRTRHCNRCGTCIPSRSHHCGVLCICIGAHNYKAFLHLLYVGTVGCLLQAIELLPQSRRTVLQLWRHPAAWTVRAVLAVQINYLLFCTAAVLFALATFHLCLIRRRAVWTDVFGFGFVEMMMPVADGCQLLLRATRV